MKGVQSVFSFHRSENWGWEECVWRADKLCSFHHKHYTCSIAYISSLWPREQSTCHMESYYLLIFIKESYDLSLEEKGQIRTGVWEPKGCWEYLLGKERSQAKMNLVLW